MQNEKEQDNAVATLPDGQATDLKSEAPAPGAELKPEAKPRKRKSNVKTEKLSEVQAADSGFEPEPGGQKTGCKPQKSKFSWLPFAPQRSVDSFALAADDKIYNAPQALGPGRFALVSLQCLLVMIAASVTVPLAMGMSVPASLLVCGLSTLIMIAATRGRFLIFTGSSAMFITVYVTILADDLNYSRGDLAFGLIVSGLGFVFLGVALWAFGAHKLRRLFDPLVAAPLTFLVGAITAMELARGSSAMWLTLLTAAAGLLALGLGSRRVRMFAPLAALVFGLIVSAVSGQFGEFPTQTTIEFVEPHFELAVIGTVLVNSLAAVFPVGALLTAGKLQSSDRKGKPAAESGYFAGTGLSLGLSGLLGAAPQLPSPYSVGLSSATGVYDPLVAAVAAAGLIILAVIPGVGGALATIPQAVGMGVGIVLCGSLMRFSWARAAELDLKNRRSSFIFFAVLVAGFWFEGAPIIIPIQGRPFVVAGLGAAAIIGTLLNLLIPKPESGKESK